MSAVFQLFGDQFRSTWVLDLWPLVFSTNWHSHLDALAKSLKKYGSLSCYLAASVIYELRGKIQMVHYGIYVPMSAWSQDRASHQNPNNKLPFVIETCGAFLPCYITKNLGLKIPTNHAIRVHCLAVSVVQLGHVKSVNQSLKGVYTLV